jgi:hypothetical protein
MSEANRNQEAFTRGASGETLTGNETHAEQMEHERGSEYRKIANSANELPSEDNANYSPDIDTGESSPSSGMSGFEVGWKLHSLLQKYGAKTKRGQIGALVIFLEAIIGSLTVTSIFNTILPFLWIVWIIFGFWLVFWYISNFRKRPMNTILVYAGPTVFWISLLIGNILESEMSLFAYFIRFGFGIIPFMAMMCFFVLLSSRIHLWYVNDLNGTSEPKDSEGNTKQTDRG